MILAIDIGNTRSKLAVFENDILMAQVSVFSAELEKKIPDFLRNYPNVGQIVTSSVGKPGLEEVISKVGLPVFSFGRNSIYPIKNEYATPETVGIDRLVLASGAVLQFPDVNRLVIDAGTCITYDFITSDNRYLGGGISPGLRLRYRALNDYTARLPLLEPNLPQDFIGASTADSIHSGVVLGAVNEVDGFINSYRCRYENFITILTGGDGEFLANQLKNTIFANPNFLLESLYRTYQFTL